MTRVLRKQPGVQDTSKHIPLVCATLLLLTTEGCGYPPSFNLLGSYFPSWLACFGAATLLTFLAHILFTRAKLIHELWPLPLLYIALVTFLTCVLWLVFFQ